MISSKLYTTTGESINSPYITWKFLQDVTQANVIDLGSIFFGFTGISFDQDLKSYPKLTKNSFRATGACLKTAV